VEFIAGNFYVEDTSYSYTNANNIIYIKNKKEAEILHLINGVPYFLYKSPVSIEYFEIRRKFKKINEATTKQVNMFKELRCQFGVELKTYKEAMLEKI
jgi:hypothetical protein